MDIKRQVESTSGDTSTQTVTDCVGNFKSWEEISCAVISIYKQIKNKNFKTILAIGNGGVIPASLLAGIIMYMNPGRAIDIKIVNASRYNGREAHALKIGNIPKVKQPVLMVDDINDTGETLYGVCRKLIEENDITRVKIATLFEKNNSKIISDYCYVRGVEGWVTFPWEI